MSPSTEQDNRFALLTHPLWQHVSPDGLDNLELFLAEGNARHRAKKLNDLAQSVDWLKVSQLDWTGLRKLPASLKRQILQAVRHYERDKAAARAEKSTKAQAYRDRVDTYFRETVSRQDKRFLEGLRDFELNLTGRDVNWQHHCRFKSFKRIDAFINSSQHEREAFVRAFQADVLLYKKNLDKLQAAAEAANNPDSYVTDDEWLEEAVRQAQQSRQTGQGHNQNRSRYQSKPSASSRKAQALKQLGLDASADQITIKKRFRALTLKHHPDRPGGSEDTMKRMIEAYAVLKG